MRDLQATDRHQHMHVCAPAKICHRFPILYVVAGHYFYTAPMWLTMARQRTRATRQACLVSSSNCIVHAQKAHLFVDQQLALVFAVCAFFGSRVHCIIPERLNQRAGQLQCEGAGCCVGCSVKGQVAV
jgi:hypothetical protein